MKTSFKVRAGLYKFEPRHEISNNVVDATSKASDQPARTRSLINSFCMRFCYLLVLFLKINLFEISSECQTVFDQDQARHDVGHYLGPNSLKRSSADDTSKQS